MRRRLKRFPIQFALAMTGHSNPDRIRDFALESREPFTVAQAADANGIERHVAKVSLHSLVAQEEIRVVVHGGGEIATTYERTEKIRQPAWRMAARLHASAFLQELVHTWTARRAGRFERSYAAPTE